MKLLLKFFLVFVLCLAFQACSSDVYLNVGNEDGGKEFVFTNAQGSSNLTINCNKDWSITSSGQWCKYSLASGNKSEIISISVDENTTGEDRECVLTVRSEDKSETLRVLQHSY